MTALADQGTPEFALEMGMDALVVARDSAFPALEALAARSGLPVIVLDGKKTLKEAAAETIRQALGHRKAAGADRPPLDIAAETAGIAGKEKATSAPVERASCSRSVSRSLAGGKARVNHML